MAALRQRKSKLTFETDRELRERGRLRPIMVAPQPWFCTVWLKGTRHRLDISWDTIYVAAAKIAADKARAEKLEARKRKNGR